MKILWSVFVKAYLIYLALTIPAFVLPVMYFMSAMYAFFAGLAAMVVFAMGFFILNKLKPHARVIVAVLLTSVIPAVSIGYAVLLLFIMPERSIIELDALTLFPIAAILAGCIAVYINIPRIHNHFSPSIIEEVNTIGVQP